MIESLIQNTKQAVINEIMDSLESNALTMTVTFEDNTTKDFKVYGSES